MEIFLQYILPLLLLPLLFLNIFGIYAGIGILIFILLNKLFLKKSYPKKLFRIAYFFIALGVVAKLLVIID